MYAIHPGYVVSKCDGQYHYIGYHKLIQLYNINPKECICWDADSPETYLGKKWEDYCHLYPKRSGVYIIEKDKEVD